MIENPYAASKAELEVSPADLQHSRAASKTLLLLSWIVWVLVMLSYAADVMVGASAKGEERASPDSFFVSVLGAGGLVMIGLVFFFRWLFFTYLTSPSRLKVGTWPSAILGIVGMFIIYGLAKLLELFGMVLIFQGVRWSYYLLFALPSFMLMILCLPPWMIGKKAARGEVA